MDTSEKIGLAAELACFLEVSADKPGNVSKHHDFLDTRYEDYIISAAAVGNVFRNVTEYSVGDLILNAVKETRKLTGVNTNLGIILLFAPLARAFAGPAGNNLRDNVRFVLKGLTVKDTELAYEAIRTAAPAGMGRVEKYDVNDNEATITLLEAMNEAKDRDSIAREYATGYEITFETGLPAFRQSLDLGSSLSEAIVQTFITILSVIPDTLIARKTGVDTARDVSNRALRVLEQGGVFSEKGCGGIKNLDKYLRSSEKSFAHTLNPGTTADLTAAVLFIYLMENDLRIQC